jgi:hypothetical protein
LEHLKLKQPKPKNFPRCHYNANKKTKKEFESEEVADKYIKKHSMKGYVSYKCRYCSYWHIGKSKEE